MKWFWRIIIIISFLLIILYGSGVIFWEKIQTFFTFPSIYREQNYSIQEASFTFEEINIKDKDGNNINGLYLPYNNGEAKTVYYFHGNGGPLSTFYSEIEYIHSLGYNVIAYDYPWYGKSDWFPYKYRVEHFSEVFYSYIKEQKNIVDEDLVIWWYSIGSAVAVDFASKNNFDKLVLVGTLASRYDISSQILGFPLQKFLFLKNSFVTKDMVKWFTKPVFMIHGNTDGIVSFDQWKKVFQNYKWKKYFVEIDHFWHNGILDNYGDVLKSDIQEFLDTWEVSWDNNYMLLTQEKHKEIKDMYEKEIYIKNLDRETDSSLTKFVDSRVHFTDLEYVPENLENIESEFVFDTKWWNQMLRKEANEALQLLAQAFQKKFNTPLSVVSSYRSYIYQKGIKDRWCPDNLCAKAGYSEHQSWLAVDVFEASSAASWKADKTLMQYYAWFTENAHTYGFHNTYQRGLEIDGYEIEPWHWRYVWIEMATYLKEKNLTFAQFHYGQKK